MSVFSKSSNWARDHMHQVMYDVSGRSLRANMTAGALGVGALGAGIGSVGGAIYGNRDTNVLAGGAIGGALGALGGAAGMYAFKGKANQYILGANKHLNELDDPFSIMGKYNKNYFTIGEPLVNDKNRRAALNRSLFTYD